MPDPTTPAKGLTQPQVGGDNNTWGGLLNANLSLIDSALGGTLPLSISGNVTLNSTQVQNGGYHFTGSLSGNATITFPAFSGHAAIRNSTTGGFSIVCGISGATVTVANGETVAVWSDGTDFIRLAATGGGATVPNSGLTNSSVTISGHSLSLGSSLGLAAVDVSGLAASATTDTTNASNITGGTLPNGRLSGVPNFALANSSLTIAGHTVSLGGTQTLAASDLTNGTTGSGDIVLQTSPAISSPTFTGTVAGAATVPNTVLVNSSITIAGHTVSLGGTQTLAATDLTNGALGSGNVVLAQADCISETSNYAVATADSGKFFNNTGATGAVNFTLPTAVAGLHYRFIVQTAQTLTVTAGTGATISIGETTSATAGNAASSSPYSTLHVVAISTTEWVITSATGSWVVT